MRNLEFASLGSTFYATLDAHRACRSRVPASVAMRLETSQEYRPACRVVRVFVGSGTFGTSEVFFAIFTSTESLKTFWTKVSSAGSSGSSWASRLGSQHVSSTRAVTQELDVEEPISNRARQQKFRVRLGCDFWTTQKIAESLGKLRSVVSPRETRTFCP